MVKSSKKSHEEDLPQTIVSKKKRISKKSIAKKSKKNDDSTKKLTVVKEKQSRNRLKEQVAVICILEGPYVFCSYFFRFWHEIYVFRSIIDSHKFNIYMQVVLCFITDNDKLETYFHKY